MADWFAPIKPFQVGDLDLVDVRYLNREIGYEAMSGIDRIAQRELDNHQPGALVCDPTKEQTFVSFAVFEQGDRDSTLGSFAIYDVIVEEHTRDGYFISASPAPAFARNGVDLPTDEVAAIMRHILSQNLETEDGQVWDFVEWTFSDVPEFRWRDHRLSTPVLSGLTRDGHDLWDRKDESQRDFPSRARKGGARPKPDEPDRETKRDAGE